MPPPAASAAVRIGHRLVTTLLVLVIGFGVLAVASIAVGLVRGGESLLYGDTITVPLQISPDDMGALPEGLRVSGWLDVTVEVHDPTIEQMLLRSAADLGPIVLVVVGLWLLRGFMRTVAQGDPFGGANVRRLRRLGFVLVAGAPLMSLLDYSLRLSLFNALPEFPSVDLGVAGYTLPGAALLGGLGVFVLAEVFAHGERLRDDVAGTI